MYFDGYGYQGRSIPFEQIYRCYPASFIEKSQIESGDKIIMPPSALDRLASDQHIDYPMLFELRNGASQRVTHCGVLEFIADEGNIYMPYWMMQNLLLQEGDTVRVINVSLPKGTYVKLQPHTKDFLDISNPKAMLERILRNYSCLSVGDTMMVEYNKKKYYIDIIETKPGNAISIIDTDCEVDLAPPLDYKPEPLPSSKPQQERVKFNPFGGTGRRLDGKAAPPALHSPIDKRSNVSYGYAPPSQGNVVFGSNFYRANEAAAMEKLVSKQEPPHQKQSKFQPFVGNKYSLKG